MNTAYRTLSTLEKDFKDKEEIQRRDVCYMTYIDTDLQSKVNYLLEKIRGYTVI